MTTLSKRWVRISVKKRHTRIFFCKKEGVTPLGDAGSSITFCGSESLLSYGLIVLQPQKAGDNLIRKKSERWENCKMYRIPSSNKTNPDSEWN